MIIKASYHIHYSRTETGCNNFLEIKVTILTLASSCICVPCFSLKQLLMVALWNSPSGCNEDTDKMSNIGVAQWHWKLHSGSYIDHYTVDLYQVPNYGIKEKILCEQLIPEFSSPMFLLSVSKMSQFSCSDSVWILNKWTCVLIRMEISQWKFGTNALTWYVAVDV